jgi:hypothetical protein
LTTFDDLDHKRVGLAEAAGSSPLYVLKTAVLSGSTAPSNLPSGRSGAEGNERLEVTKFVKPGRNLEWHSLLNEGNGPDVNRRQNGTPDGRVTPIHIPIIDGR